MLEDGLCIVARRDPTDSIGNKNVQKKKITIWSALSFFIAPESDRRLFILVETRWTWNPK